MALGKTDGPVALILTRQKLPTMDRARYGAASGVARGAYVLAEAAGAPGDPRRAPPRSSSSPAAARCSWRSPRTNGWPPRACARASSISSPGGSSRTRRRLSRERAAGGLPLSAGRRGRCDVRLGALGRRRGRGHRHRPFRSVGSCGYSVRAVRLHRRPRLRTGTRLVGERSVDRRCKPLRAPRPAPQIRAEPLVRLHQPRAGLSRRPQEDGRQGRARRSHQQSFDLRKGDRLREQLRQGDPRARARRSDRRRDLRSPRHQRRARRLRRARARVHEQRRPGRLRLHRGLAAPRRRRSGDGRTRRSASSPPWTGPTS